MKSKKQPGTYEHYVISVDDHEIGEYKLCWPTFGNIIELWNFEVYPKFRGQGYGRALLLDAISRAPKRPGRVWLLLQVKRNNYKAIKLYKSGGFVVASVERDKNEYTMTRFL